MAWANGEISALLRHKQIGPGLTRAIWSNAAFRCRRIHAEGCWPSRPGSSVPMQARGSYSNQDPGSFVATVSEALVALSAHGARSGLGRLAEKLAALRASGAEPRLIRSRRRRTRRPGWVLDAVCRVLADQATGPMRVMSVHAAVEALVGGTVSKDSVSWVLSSHSASPSPLFVRVARGRYMLAGAP